MRRVDLFTDESVDFHFGRLLKNWVTAIIPARHNRQRLLQRAALIRASRRPKVALREILLIWFQTIFFVPVDIANHPVLYAEPEIAIPDMGYRRYQEIFPLRMAPQYMTLISGNLGSLASL